MNAAATARLTADERRDSVVLAATAEFAAGGFAGTSTETIARRAGVSQPYLFQLFGTKKDLFIAAVRACFVRTRQEFEDTGRAARAENPTPTYVLDAMGHAYMRLLADRDLLRLELHAYAACEDPDIRVAVREEFGRLYRAVERVSGADEAALHAWFAEGMLLNVAAAIGTGPLQKMSLAASLGGAPDDQM